MQASSKNSPLILAIKNKYLDGIYTDKKAMAELVRVLPIVEPNVLPHWWFVFACELVDEWDKLKAGPF